MPGRSVSSALLGLAGIAGLGLGSPGHAVSFEEGFEGYAPGAYPPAPWTNLFDGAGGVVTTEQAHAGTQSFRSESASTWARWDCVALTVPGWFRYGGAIYLTAPDRGGAVGFGFVQPGASSTGRIANAVHFANNGNVYFSTRTAGSTLLGAWSANEWIELEVFVDYGGDNAEARIGGGQWTIVHDIDPPVLPASLYGEEVPLNQFGVFGDNFSGTGTSVIYYDDLFVEDLVSIGPTSWSRIKAPYRE